MSDLPFFHGAGPSTFGYARVLRKNMTFAEKELWKFIRGNQIKGMRFRRQHPVGSYILDFYCNEVKLAIEVDGPCHQTVDQQAYDRLRELEIEKMGIKIIRFTNEDVFQRMDNVLYTIGTYSKTPSPERGGLGRGKV